MKKIFIILIFITFDITAQQTISPKEFKVYKDSVNTVIKGLEKKLDDGKDALEKAEKVYERSEQYVGLAERIDNFSLTLLGILLTLYAGAVGFYIWYIKGVLETKLLASVSEKIDTKIDVLGKTVKEYKHILDLKAEKRILIVSKIGDNNQPYETLTGKLNYSFVELDSKADNNFNLTKKTYDIIIFDNENNGNANWNLTDSKTKQNLINYIGDVVNNNIKFIYFGKFQNDGGIGKEPVFNDKTKATFCSDINNLEDYIIKLLK